MPLMTTPGELRRRAELYEQWATLLASGVPMLRAVATLRRSAFALRYRRLLDRVAERLDQGETVPEALAPERRSIPPFDLALLRTGDRSGRLDICLKDLAGHYRLRAKWLTQTIHACAYPMLLLAISLFVFPIDLIVTIFTEGDWMPYLLHKARIIGMMAAAGLVLAIVLGLGPVRRILECIGAGVPVLGSALRERALARLILALDALLNTGMGAVDAWPSAAEASGSPRLRREVNRWTPTLQNGHPISESLARSRLFPDLFTDAYRVGETSGKMQDTLDRLRQHYEESAGFKMEQLATWVPRIIYIAVVFYVASSVLGFWQGYWSQFDSLL